MTLEYKQIPITHLGITVNRSWGGQVNSEIVNAIRNGYYSNHELEDVARQVYNVVLRGGTNISMIYGYWFERIANDCRLHHSFFSINEVLESDELIQFFYDNTLKNKDVFNGDLIDNFKTAIRIGGKGISGKLSNFLLSECKRFLLKYKVSGGTYYIDTSCGWGVRMLASAAVGLDYVGFDVNPLLIKSLNEMGEVIKRFIPDWNFRVISHGSQFLETDLIGKGSILFTSPPYFFLEDYRHGAQSCTKETSFDDWCNEFLYPTLDNSFQYASENAPVIINIKDYKGFNMVERTINYGKSKGFHVSFDVLKNIARPTSEKTDETQFADTNEDVIIFTRNPLEQGYFEL